MFNCAHTAVTCTTLLALRNVCEADRLHVVRFVKNEKRHDMKRKERKIIKSQCNCVIFGSRLIR